MAPIIHLSYGIKSPPKPGCPKTIVRIVGITMLAFLLLAGSASAAPVTYLCPDRVGGGGVFELRVPSGSSWKIRGPFGYFGPGGTYTDAPWAPISGTLACIQTDSCDAFYTVYLKGPDGTVKTFQVNSLRPENCHVIINYQAITAPTVDFTANPVSGNAPLDIQFTDASTGTITSYSWDFGDGSTSTSQNPSHTYAGAGIYTVTLTAGNTGGSDTMTRTNYITVITPNNPPDISHAYPSVSCLWPPNHKSVDVTINGVTDPEGDPVTIAITTITCNEPFVSDDVSGVGTDTAQLRAERAGDGSGRIYTISFTANDGEGEEASGTVNVCVPHDQRGTCTCNDQAELQPTTQPTVTPTPTPTPTAPVAAFTATPLTGTAPLEVTFTDQSTNSPASWSWDFGDGITSTSQNPSHTYPMHLTGTGIYTVSLTAGNAGGSDTMTRTNYISVTLTGSTCQDRVGGGGVFELIVPSGSSWRIRGPFGYFGPSGTFTGALWEPISGTMACIGTDTCDASYTVYLQGPDGTVKVWEVNSLLAENCHAIIDYSS